MPILFYEENNENFEDDNNDEKNEIPQNTESCKEKKFKV